MATSANTLREPLAEATAELVVGRCGAGSMGGKGGSGGGGGGGASELGGGVGTTIRTAC